MYENDVETATCPHCRDGKYFHSHLGYFVECQVCNGRGHIISNKLCACGGPVLWISSDKLFYCGEKECLKNLRAETAQKPKSETTSLPRYQTLSNCTSFPGYGDRGDE